MKRILVMPVIPMLLCCARCGIIPPWVETYGQGETALIANSGHPSRQITLANDINRIDLKGTYLFAHNRNDYLRVVIEFGDDSYDLRSSKIAVSSPCADSTSLIKDKSGRFLLFVRYNTGKRTLLENDVEFYERLLREAQCEETTVDISEVMGENTVIKFVRNPEEIGKLENRLAEEKRKQNQ